MGQSRSAAGTEFGNPVSRRNFLGLAGLAGVAAFTKRIGIKAAAPLGVEADAVGGGLVSPSSSLLSANPFGAMVYTGSRSSRAQVLLGLGCQGGWTRFGCEVGREQRRSAAANDTAFFMDRGYNVILTTLWTSTSPAAPDEASYRAALRDLLQRCGTKKPGLIVVNNEQDQRNNWPRDPVVPYRQDVSRYLAQLSWAADVAADFGVPVADGGISTGRVRQTTYIHLLDTLGDAAAAQAYAHASANFPEEETPLTNPAKLPELRAKAQEARDFLTGIGSAGAAYCNMHYYAHDGGSFRTAINAFRDISGLPMLCNERGHRGNDPEEPDAPAIVQGAMQAAFDEGLAVLITYSTDVLESESPGPNPLTPFAYRIRALHDPLTLLPRPTGIAHNEMVAALVP